MLQKSWRSFLGGFLLLAPAAAFAQGVEFADAFDGPDGARPSGWTIVGAIDDAYWQRKDGAFYTGDGDDYKLGTTWAVLDRPGSDQWSNYTVGVDFRMVQALGNVCIAARWRNERSFYHASLEASTDASNPTTRIHIYKTSGGTTRSIASAGAPEGLLLPPFYSRSSGNPVRFDFQVDGSNLRALVNGNIMVEAQDTEFATGGVAIGQDQNEIYFDNFRVTASFDPDASVPIGGDSIPGPPAAGGTKAWRVLVLDKKDRGTADGMAVDLSNYPHVEVVAEGIGSYSVYVGRYATSAEAAAAAQQLIGDGFLLPDQTPREFTVAGAVAATPPPTPARTPDIIPTVTPELPPEVLKAQKLQQMVEAANGEEAKNNIAGAIDLWYDVKAAADSGDAMWMLADENLRRLNRSPQGPGSDIIVQPLDKEGAPIGLIIGGVVGLLVVGGGVFFFLKTRGRKSAPVAAKAPAPDAATPGGTPRQPSLLAPIPVAALRGTPKAEPTPRAGSTMEVGPDARIRPGTVSPAPQHEPTPRAPVPAPPRAEPTPRTPPRPEPTPRTAPPAAQQPPRRSTEESGVKLDFLFDNAPQAAAPKTPKREDTSEFFEPPAPDQHTPPPAAPEPTPPAIGGPASDQAIFYAQDFEGEPVGASPANWKGDYEYAALKVHGEGTAGGSKCLRFEKKNGVGSAYYSCRFPNASGRIGVEFDMRCDDKNKYLLGFYIEKDEDFRQSIHTIVHRTNSNAKPTLRLQNEACNYDFGRWTHIRFEIDLPRHIIDGYVDEKPIAMGTRLNNCPKYVNTLSIRDNLATAGVLLIDNIRIYRL